MKQQNYTGFADMSVQKRMIKKKFFDQLNKIIDWTLVEQEIEKNYTKGKSKTGRPSYPAIMLFKICLLQTWYKLSDYDVEDELNDRITFSNFVGLSMDNKCPDHSIICRFRKEMKKNQSYEKVLELINRFLAEHEIFVKTGVIIDASIMDTPRKPRGRKEVSVLADDNDRDVLDDETEKEALATPTADISTSGAGVKANIQKHVDTDGHWVKKGGKLRYGYKKHVVTTEEGLVISLETTAANVHEISNFKEVIEKAKLPRGAKVKGDKGYKSKKNDEILVALGLKNHLMLKKNKGQKLKDSEQRFNQLISKVRYKIERTFGSMVVWFGSGRAKYVGKEKMHQQNLIEAIAHNLYRAPRMIMQQELKTKKLLVA